MGEGTYRTMYPTGCIAPYFMDYQIFINLVPPLDLLYLVGAQLLMGWLKSLLRY